MFQTARRRLVSHILLMTMLVTSAGNVYAVNPFEWLNRRRQDPIGHQNPPEKKPLDPVEHLSWQIDWLERNIDEFGTVVAKVPDVWGERRLMKHRQEYEDILSRELNAFDKNRISGAKFIQDQAFLAAALSVQAAATDASGTPSTTTNLQLGVPATAANASQTSAGNGQTTISITGITSGAAPSPAPGFGFKASDLEFAKKGGIQLEQTVQLDQLSRYLHHLHELRRINEGDDTADAPGYALHLVRIPISVLPGHKTRKGHGAEITLTAEPYLGPELLPMAFRDLVINDLIDQIAVPLTRFLNGNPKQVRYLMECAVPKQQELFRGIAELNEQLKREPCLANKLPNQARLNSAGTFFDENVCYRGAPPITRENLSKFIAEFVGIITTVRSKRMKSEQFAKLSRDLTQLYSLNLQQPALNAFGPGLVLGAEDSGVLAQEFKKTRQDLSSLDSEYKYSDLKKLLSAIPDDLSAEVSENEIRTVTDVAKAAVGVTQAYQTTELSLMQFENRTTDKLEELVDSLKTLRQETESLLENAVTVVHLPSATRKASLPFPATQMADTYGLTNLGIVAKRAYDSFKRDLINKHVVHVTDVQAFLREELFAAYELMSTKEMRVWWETEANSPRNLYNLVRQRRVNDLIEYRKRFRESLGPRALATVSGALAWCVLVESALLNERLIRDMRETSGNRGCACFDGGWLPFFGPDPPPEARALFVEYVKCRWPVRVFALDPVTSEQNIAEVSSIYREMQIAVALSFAAGNTGFQSAMQAMRRLQRDTATIALNRTIVGFGHGNDTFGWRFFPRFQTPPVQGNMTVFFRDLIAGGPTDEQLRRQQRIEPGMRECVALIVMPSFIPYVTFDARGNWFKLTNPGHTAVNMINTVRYSRAVQSMRETANYAVEVEHLYRDGEVRRLLRRVHQLDRELPMQTMSAQVPHENTLGGFEMFSAGTSELAPELLGWYGAPGINRNQPTRMFLSGDNFSVHQTRLIVGNSEIPIRMLSRQILEVNLPPGLPFVPDDNLYDDPQYEGYVDAHVATPYGVSGHLLIPMIRDRTALFGSAMVRIQPATIRLRFEYTPTDPGSNTSPTADFDPDANAVAALRVEVPANLGFPDNCDEINFYPRSGRDELARIPVTNVRLAPDGRGYSISGSKYAEFVETLHPKIKDYVDHLLKFNLLKGRTIELIMSAYIKPTSDSPVIEAKGNVIIQVTVGQKN